MEPRLTLVTLGVTDVATSRAFYERLGFTASSDSNASVTFFEAGGVALALFGRQALADDAGVSDGEPGFRGVSLAHNVRHELEVDRVINEAARAGARIVKPPQKTFWGGYAGYFSDPDGHLWEVAHNPHWPMDEAGQIKLSDPVAHQASKDPHDG